MLSFAVLPSAKVTSTETVLRDVTPLKVLFAVLDAVVTVAGDGAVVPPAKVKV